jgi:hypothetical protein
LEGWRRERFDGRRRLAGLDRIGSMLAHRIWMLTP